MSETTIEVKNQLNCLNSNLRKASRVILSLYMNEMRESGLQGTQFTLLSTIAGMQRATVGDLARFMLMDQTTVTRNVKVLQKSGLVDVIPGEDRRTRLVGLTPQGYAAVENTKPMWETAQSNLWEQLGDEKARQLLEITNAICQLAPSK